MKKVKNLQQIDQYYEDTSFDSLFGFDVRPYTSLVRFEPDEVVVRNPGEKGEVSDDCRCGGRIFGGIRVDFAHHSLQARPDERFLPSFKQRCGSGRIGKTEDHAVILPVPDGRSGRRRR